MIVSYDTSKYDFASHLKNVYCMELNQIHTITNTANNRSQEDFLYDLFTLSSEKSIFLNLYTTFVSDIIVPTYKNESFVYVQTEPQIRMSLPGFSALKSYTTDFDDLVGVHIDSVIGGRVINTGDNYLLALSNMFDTNTLFVETEGQFSPVNIDYGQYYTFQGKSTRHANKINQTGVTRISMDFRVIPGSQSEDENVDLRFSTKYIVNN